jgi:hypothetical protein
MLKMTSIVKKHGIAFPAMPQVGINGEEIPDFSEEDLIPVFRALAATTEAEEVGTQTAGVNLDIA